MFNKNFIKIIILVSFVVVLLVVMIGIYNIYFSKSTLIRVPLLNNVFIAKRVDNEFSEKELFDRYVLYMDNLGYVYMPNERMGGGLFFKKGDKKVFTSYPKFIKIK